MSVIYPFDEIDAYRLDDYLGGGDPLDFEPTEADFYTPDVVLGDVIGMVRLEDGWHYVGVSSDVLTDGEVCASDAPKIQIYYKGGADVPRR